MSIDEKSPETAPSSRRFPPGFLWGAATAAYQIEGATTIDGRGPSIWDEFCATPGATRGGDTGEIACDHYHRYREDIEIMRRLHLQAYRFSISWPRVMPEGRCQVSAPGLAFSDRLVDALLEAGIEPFVTLYHWDLPAALQRHMNGWLHSDLPNLFADYADLMFNKLGDRVRFWLTLNEPWVVVDAGYFRGTHPPGIKNPAEGYQAGHNLMRAHAYAVACYRGHQCDGGRISFALNTTFSFPESRSASDQAAAERAMDTFGGWFADPAWSGDYPAVMRERLGPMLPEFSAEDADLLRRSMDFLALNYYTSDIARYSQDSQPFEFDRIVPGHLPCTEMGWPIMPDGLARLLRRLHQRYAGLPVYITENGAACPDNADEHGFVDDQDRIGYLAGHVAAMAEAVADGVDVRGYFVWSLLDNLEWTEGYSKRFGLVRCDRTTLQRTIKASGLWYADLIAMGRLPAALVDKPPVAPGLPAPGPVATSRCR